MAHDQTSSDSLAVRLAAEAKLRVVPRDADDPVHELVLPLREFFTTEPGAGFSIVDVNGLIWYVNRRSAEMFLETSRPEDLIGRSLVDLYGDLWAAERIAAFREILRSGKPVVVRHIRNGQRLQSTIRVITAPDVTPARFSVLTTLGRHEVDPADGFHVMESDLVHLGPLESLTHRELEVLALVGHGMTSVQIGETLFRSPRTIEQHLSSIREKLHAASRIEIAGYAQRAGLTLSDADRIRLH